jgi:uncharacterized protein YggE
MKTISKQLLVALVSALVVLGLKALLPQPAAAAAPATAPVQASGACDPARSVEVSGAAVVYVTPDRALIQLGVQSNGASPDAVHDANIQKIQQVINAVRALGVDAKDIATDYYLVYPVYQDYNALEIKGYRIDNTVSITLRNVNLADDTLLAALKAGANEVQDVQFYTSELRKYRDQARSLAIQAGSEKAQSLAGSAGAQSGCVLTISENTWTQYYGSWRGGRETALWAQNVIQNASSSGAQSASAQSDDSPISLGQIAVRAEVSSKYSLK